MTSKQEYQLEIELGKYRIFTDQEHVAQAVFTHLSQAPERPDTTGVVIVAGKRIHWESTDLHD